MTDSKIKDLSNKFKNWTRGSRSLSTLTSERFPPIHAQVIASNLNIIDKGKNDGEHNLPATNATQLSATELAIKSEIEKHQKSYLETFSKNMETNKARYLECTQLWDLHLIKNEENRLVDAVIGKGKSVAGDFFEMGSNLVNHAKELDHFRKEHSLTHRSPNKKAEWNVYLILLLAFVFESAITFFLTREGGSTTTTITIAVLYCLINCGIPFYFSNFVKWVNYKPEEFNNFKIAGWIILISLIALIVFFNLGMGHYRSAAINSSIGPANSLAEVFQNMQSQNNLINIAWNNLLESPFGVIGLLSWSLIIVGFFCAIITFYDGLTYKDIYPQYHDLTEKYIGSFESYEKMIDETTQELNELRKGGEKAIDELGDRLRESFEQAPHILLMIESTKESCNEAINNLESVFNLLCRTYQMENEKFRKTEGPEYFKNPISFKKSDLPKIEIIIKEPDETALISRVSEYSERLHSEYSRLIQEIKTSEKILDGKNPLEIS
jgi:hypothetical protein